MTMFSESLRAFLRPVVPFLDDETVTEILINGPDDIWIERSGKLEKTSVRFTEEGLLGAARNMAQFVGRPLTEERPRLDARLPDGSRIHVILPPLARNGTTVSIRKFFREKLSMNALLKMGSLSPAMSRVIEAAVATKLNVIVSGGTGSGKTTFLNVVSSLLGDEERILTLEDSAELQLQKRHVVSLESRPADKFGKGAVDLGELLNSALRLRPDRIVVGEVRAGECFHLLQAMNTGHAGSLSTVHANTPEDTLRRLETLCLMSAVELPLIAVRAQVASAIHFIAMCERLNDGTRRITHLSEVLPLSEKGEYRTQDLFVFTQVGTDAKGRVVGYHAPTGVVPHFAARARAMGLTDLDAAFFDPATYGLPAPPAYAAGHAQQTQWAPSLEHRARGAADPAAVEQSRVAYARKLMERAELQARDSGVGAASPAPGAADRSGDTLNDEADEAEAAPQASRALPSVQLSASLVDERRRQK